MGAAFLDAAVLTAGLPLFGAALVLVFAAVLPAADFFAGAFSGLVLGSGKGSASGASHILVGGTTGSKVKGSAAAFKGAGRGGLMPRGPAAAPGRRR